MRYSLLSAWPTWWSRPRRPIFLYYLVLSLMRLSYSLRTQTGWGHLRACNFPSGMDTMTNWRWMLDMLSVVRSPSKLRPPFFKLLTTPCRLLGINFCIDLPHSNIYPGFSRVRTICNPPRWLMLWTDFMESCAGILALDKAAVLDALIGWGGWKTMGP